MPRTKIYADANQRKRAYRLRKRTAKHTQSEQIQTIKEGGLFGGLFELEKPDYQVWEHDGQKLKIMVISVPLAIENLEATENGLTELSDAQKNGFKVIDQERYMKNGMRYIRYTLSKRKR